MVMILVVLSVLSAAAGFLELTQATVGVGALAAACLLAILARLNQAADHQRDLMSALKKLQPPPETPTAA